MKKNKTKSQKSQNHDQNHDQKFSQEKYSFANYINTSPGTTILVNFGAFLLSETVLLGAITSIDKNDSNNLIFWGSILGILISLLWLITLLQPCFLSIEDFEARELEPQAGEFFTNGNKLYEGESVLNVKIPWIVRKLRPKISLWFLIGLYDIAFIYLAIINLPWIDR
ncbi:MAG: hypothetical protein IPJ37_10905 [Bacteroidales bacterium]|nr:hypothetical protein [Bacteroidales bacterium]